MPKAIIFDLDGTILLNEPVYCAAFKTVLETLVKTTSGPCPQIVGLALEENWTALIKKHQIKTDKTPAELALATQQEYLKHLGKVRLAPGLLSLLDDLKSHHWLTALATSNNWWLVEAEIDHFRLENQFNCITTREEALFPKPAPNIFLETAEKLQIEPAKCIVIENSVIGIEAALAAGMKAVAITWPEQPKDVFISAGAHLIVSSLTELNSENLATLI